MKTTSRAPKAPPVVRKGRPTERVWTDTEIKIYESLRAQIAEIAAARGGPSTAEIGVPRSTLYQLLDPTYRNDGPRGPEIGTLARIAEHIGYDLTVTFKRRRGAK